MAQRAATALLLYCRAGFEGECAKELAQIATAAGLDGFVRSKPDAAYVEYVLHEPLAADRVRRAVRFRDLVFARQLVAVSAWIGELPTGDRIRALMPAILQLGTRFSGVRLETADTNEAKELSSFCRKFGAPLESALRDAGLIDRGDRTMRRTLRADATLHLDAGDPATQRAPLADADPALPALHLFFTGSSRVAIGWSDPDNASPWPMGIPRLAMPRQAPSRSTQKLAEAIEWFLTPDEQRDSLHEGMTAVDLGAAPGGWTWQLVRRGVSVEAVDNGPIDRALLDTGLVEHLRADGFAYRPRHPVEWMVCDIVEQPIRVARLVASWLADGDARRSIFNLKLPMKKRYDEIARCRDAMAAIWDEAGVRCDVRFRHLYHDREEVTGYAIRIGGGAGRKKSVRRRDR